MKSKRTNYYQTIESIMKTSRYITEQVSKVLKPFDITEAQYNVLRILEDLDGQSATIQEIQDEMYHQSSNVSRIIDKLVAKLLVHRKINPQNRRKMDITLTKKGSQAIKTYNQLVHNFHKPHLNALKEDELEHLIELLNKLNGGNHEEN